jgi:hypothetical protein
MNFQKKVTKNNYIREFVILLNGLLDLSPREVDVLSSLIKIDSNWVSRSTLEVKDLLSTDSRRLAMKECNMSKSNITKMINKFKEINLLVLSQDGKYVVNELLKPTITNGKIEVTFILNVADAV